MSIKPGQLFRDCTVVCFSIEQKTVPSEIAFVCGAVLYCDGGTSALLHPEKFY
jgi:hypothetical protein